MPFLGQQMMPVIELLNDVLQRRTGLSDAAKGLDPKALQSSTMIGVEAIINGAQERIELVARVLAETGFKDLFVGLYNEVCRSAEPAPDAAHQRQMDRRRHRHFRRLHGRSRSTRPSARAPTPCA